MDKSKRKILLLSIIAYTVINFPTGISPSHLELSINQDDAANAVVSQYRDKNEKISEFDNRSVERFLLLRIIVSSVTDTWKKTRSRFVRIHRAVDFSLISTTFHQNRYSLFQLLAISESNRVWWLANGRIEIQPFRSGNSVPVFWPTGLADRAGMLTSEKMRNEVENNLPQLPFFFLT